MAKSKPEPDAIRRVLEDRVKDLERTLEIAEREGLDVQRSSRGEGGLDVADLGTEMLEREKAISIRDSVYERLAEARLALERLNAGRYGSCETCGEPIPPERLAARPEARFCVKHQEEILRT